MVKDGWTKQALSLIDRTQAREGQRIIRVDLNSPFVLCDGFLELVDLVIK